MFRLNNIPNLGNILTLPVDKINVILILLILTILGFAVAVLFWTLVFKIPTRTELAHINRISNISKNIEYSILNVEELPREEAEKRKRTDIELARLRINLLPEEIKPKIILNIIIGVGIFMAGIIIGIVIMKQVNKPIGLIVCLASIVASIYKAFSFQILKFRRTRALNRDLITDLYKYVTVYQYVPKTTNRFNFIKKYLPQSNSLKVDFSMLLSDMNTLGELDALDEFARRINIKEFYQFSIILKSMVSGFISEESFSVQITTLAQKLEEIIKEREAMRNAKQLMVLLLSIVLGFATAGLLSALDKVVFIEQMNAVLK